MKPPLLQFGAVMIILMAAAAGGSAATRRGPADIDIPGGNSGKVSFPHARHQDRLGDCNPCHQLFPQEHEAIGKMKAAGRLMPKQVMNTQCIQCHKQEKQAGNPHGPLTCDTCHMK